MKWSNIVFLVMVAVLTGCAAARKTPAPANLDGNWKLAVFPYQKKTFAEVFGNRMPTLSFDSNAGRVSGSTGCNRFSGNYTATTDSLQFAQNRALTRMACGEYDETLFLNAFDRITRYRLIEGQLELMNGTEIVMIFARTE